MPGRGARVSCAVQAMLSLLLLLTLNGALAQSPSPETVEVGSAKALADAVRTGKSNIKFTQNVTLEETLFPGVHAISPSKRP
jgi:hypothetical protein